MAETGRQAYPPIERIIGTIASITTVAILFATQRQLLSFQAQVAVVSVIAVLIILFFVWVWYRPLTRFVSKRWLARKDGKIARENLGALESFVQQLLSFCNHPHRETLVFPILTLRGPDNVFGNDFRTITDLNPTIAFVTSFCYQVDEACRLVKVSKATFAWEVATFNSVIRMLNFGLTSAVNDIRMIAEQKAVPKGVKEDYNTYRHTYIRFLDDYETFLADLNKKFSEDVMQSMPLPALQNIHVERPKEL